MVKANEKGITLVAYDMYPNRLLTAVINEVEKQFKLPVTVVELREDLSHFFDAMRKQYNGNQLLTEIEKLTPENAVKTVGLYHVDLFIPILTFIFGQGFLNGKAAIASFYRLRNELYGMMPDEDVLIRRFAQVVVHELGHTFGLKHCYVPQCVMISSTYVEDLDQKSLAFCDDCQDLLQKQIEAALTSE